MQRGIVFDDYLNTEVWIYFQIKTRNKEEVSKINIEFLNVPFSTKLTALTSEAFELFPLNRTTCVAT